jgi:hypothetical protein
MPNQTNNPLTVYAASAGSPVIDPLMRMYLETRWRACITELRFIAPLLGWADRLPQKVN